jgi:hypothetical protein
MALLRSCLLLRYNVLEGSGGREARSIAIIRVDPPEWAKFNVVQLDSDAAENREALIEMEDWAHAHGFARTNEYHLRRVRTAAGPVFRGICYRLTPEECASNEAAVQESDEALARLPVTLREGSR